MDEQSAALQLAGELQRCGNVVSALRGTTLVVDVSQPNTWEDLTLSLRENDDFKNLKLSEDGGEFSYAGLRFKVTLDGIVAYIDVIT
jgi:hypothetical protein